MVSGIYAITNEANGKIYVGQSNNINRRYREHFSMLRHNRHSNEHLQSAWNKYGENNFTFNVLKECPISNLDNWERWFISSTQSSNKRYGYNKELGGNLNKILSEETKEKIRKNHKHYFRGKHHTEKAKQLISKANKGKLIGNKHPMAFYDLWDNHKVRYHKYKMFRNNREPNPIGCFGLKYNGKSVNVGCFMDFVTPTLLNDFIKENDMDGSV